MTDLFVYWEGYMPDWIAFCINSIRKSCSKACKFHHITPFNLNYYLPNGIPHKLQYVHHPAIRADYIRVQLLTNYGGFYFDADTIGLNCPSPLASEHDLLYCVWTKPPKRVLNGYVYCKPNSELAKEWACVLEEKANTFTGQPGWGSWGEKILTPLVDSNNYYTQQLPLSTFLPIDIDSEVETLFAKKSPDKFIKENTVCFGLNHSWMMDKRPTEMKCDLSRMRHSPLLIHRLITLVHSQIYQ
jgi:hypothetical protein